MTVGQLLAEQFAKGQDNYSNPTSALYDTNILLNLLQVLIILAAVGAFMNVIPFFWYDFNEIKQKSVVRVLKVRAMFEDFGNKVSKDEVLVEGIEIIRKARELVNASPKKADKKTYRSEKNKDLKLQAKKAYKEALEYNNEIKIAKFVCDELDRFSLPAGRFAYAEASALYAQGINAILTMDKDSIKEELRAAKAMSKASADEKEIRKTAIENAKKKLTALSAVKKNFRGVTEITQPDFAELDGLYDREDEINAEMKSLYLELSASKEFKDSVKKAEIQQKIASLKGEKKALQKKIKDEMNRHAYFNRAAKPYLDAEKLVKQADNYTHLGDIEAEYEAAKSRVGSTVQE